MISMSSMHIDQALKNPSGKASKSAKCFVDIYFALSQVQPLGIRAGFLDLNVQFKNEARCLKVPEIFSIYIQQCGILPIAL